MRRFRISGSFEAEDLDDALALLYYHFGNLRFPITGALRPVFHGEYEIRVEPEAESATTRAEQS